MTHHILLAGASRGVGREIAKNLIQRSLKVKALLRSPETQPDLEALGIKVALGNALNPTEVEAALLSEPISVVNACCPTKQTIKSYQQSIAK